MTGNFRRINFVIFCFLFLSFLDQNQAFAKKAEKNNGKQELAFPENGAALDAIELNISSVTRMGFQLFLGVVHKSIFVETPFYGKKKSQIDSFGDASKSLRRELNKSFGRGSVQAIEVLDEDLWIFDGVQGQIGLIKRKNFEELNFRTFAWDLLRPPPDRGGEATPGELAKLRSEFSKAYFAAGEVKFSGAVLDKAQLLAKKSSAFHEFFVSTKIKEFPLVTLRCSKEDESLCNLERACRLDRFQIKNEHVEGIAQHPKTGHLWILDGGAKKIEEWRFTNCLKSTKISEVFLPPKIKAPNGIFIDADQNLWISSGVRDDYNNAAVYLFEDWR